MIRFLAPIILIYISQTAYAAGEGASFSAPEITPREIATISELIPDLEDLECQSQCEGAPGCGQFTDVDSCVDEGQARGCFWSCK